jgi:NADPH:quinone reductase-like Zn-dependent oxidoreductase
MATMKAVLVDDTSGPKFRTDYPKPVRKSGDVLVKVIRVGICKTDLEILSGYSGFKGWLIQDEKEKKKFFLYITDFWDRRISSSVLVVQS